MSSSMFTGMAVGAGFWGAMADALGRRVIFPLTLLVSALSGIAAGYASSFAVLCLLLVILGFGVGGSMPVDGLSI